MRLYKYVFGDWEKYGPAEDDKDAYERRVSIDPQFHYVPVMIEEVIIEGYEITVSPISTAEVPQDREVLKGWLNDNGVKFFNGAPDEKLKELYLINYQKQLEGVV